MKKVVVGLSIVVAVVGGSSIAWANARSSATGTNVCVPRVGAVTAPNPDGECARGAAKVTVANLADVVSLDQRVATLESAPSASDSGASESHIATPYWFSAGCGEEAWLFVNCKSDPAAPPYPGAPPRPLNTDYGMTIDGSRYPNGATWTMDVRYRTSGRSCVRLFDLTANAPVVESEYCVSATQATIEGRAFSTPFALPEEPHDYLVQAKNSLTCPAPSYCWSSGGITIRDLVARW